MEEYVSHYHKNSKGLAQKTLSDIFPGQKIHTASIHSVLGSLWAFKRETL